MCNYGDIGDVSPRIAYNSFITVGNMAVYAFITQRGENNYGKQAYGPLCTFIFFKKRHSKRQTIENFINFMAHFNCRYDNMPQQVVCNCNSCNGGHRGYNTPLLQKGKEQLTKKHLLCAILNFQQAFLHCASCV